MCNTTSTLLISHAQTCNESTASFLPRHLPGQAPPQPASALKTLLHAASLAAAEVARLQPSHQHHHYHHHHSHYHRYQYCVCYKHRRITQSARRYFSILQKVSTCQQRLKGTFKAVWESTWSVSIQTDRYLFNGLLSRST